MIEKEQIIERIGTTSNGFIALDDVYLWLGEMRAPKSTAIHETTKLIVGMCIWGRAANALLDQRYGERKWKTINEAGDAAQEARNCEVAIGANIRIDFLFEVALTENWLVIATAIQEYWDRLKSLKGGIDPFPFRLSRLDSSPKNVGNDKKWTEEALTRLKADREKHGTLKAGEMHGISDSRVRQLLPTEEKIGKPRQADPFTGLGARHTKGKR